MNTEEKKIYNSLLSLVAAYKNEGDSKKQINLYKQINDLAPNGVDADYLNNYECSVSLEEFCSEHSVITNNTITYSNSEIQSFISLIVKSYNDDDDKLSYYIKKYQEPIELFYKKNSGTLSDYIYFEAEKNIITETDILEQLQDSDIIIL